MNVFSFVRQYLKSPNITKITISIDGEITYETMTSQGPKIFYVDRSGNHIPTTLPRVAENRTLKNGIINTFDEDGVLNYRGIIRSYYEECDNMELNDIINSN